MKTGRRLWIVSDDRSISMDTNPKATTPGGTDLRAERTDLIGLV